MTLIVGCQNENGTRLLRTKTWIIMKLTILLLLFFTFHASAKSYAQRVTIFKKHASLPDIFNAIEHQTDFLFFYDKTLIEKKSPIDITIENGTIDEALSACLKDQQLTYKIVKNTIVILPQKKLTLFAGVLRNTDAIPPPVEIHGRVLNERGEPLQNVSVMIAGTKTGTSTDSDGRFTLTAPDNNKNLVLDITSVGYQTKRLKVGKETEITINLKEELAGLNEVVVVGYGKVNRQNLTGAVVSVSGKELTRTPTVSLTNSITGMLPGVVTKNVTGEPGKDAAVIFIRGRNTTGNNNPLVVVDGIQNASGWEHINPNDVESISVLKDASAAIYGSEAANGVILITTKRGRLGKPTISYTFNQGVNEPTQVPKMANSASLARYFNEILIKQGQTPKYTEDEIKKFEDGNDPLNYPNVNWFDEVLKKSSSQSQHNLSMRGGSKDIKYMVSGSYSNQNSIFKNGSTNFKTSSLRSNLDAQVNKYIKVALDVNGGIDEGNYPAFSTKETFQALNNNLPFMPVFYSNGLPSSGVERAENPILMVSDATGNNNHMIQRFSAKVSFDIEIPWVDGLGVDGYFNYRNVNVLDKNWQKPWTDYSYDKSTNTYNALTGGGIVNPQLEQGFENDKNGLINLRLRYDKRFNNHYLNTFIAVEQSQGTSLNFSAFRRNFISDQLDQLFAGSLINQQTDGSASEEGRKNLFGRIHYDFKGKYLLDFNYRYDGSSNFRKGSRYGFFPGLSVAWKLSDESFIKNRLSFIDNLKLRASIGQIGNDRIAAFQFLQLYNLTSRGYNFGNPTAQSLGLTAGVTPNPNVTWEVATISNVGLDGTLWHGLFGFSADLFRQRRSNILATRSLAIPNFTGLSLPNENIGIVENKGFEIELSHSKSIRSFSYRIAGNFAYASNKVIDISEASNVPQWQKAEGHAIGANQYYISTGIIRTQAELDKIPVYPGTKVGDLKYKDVNGDGVISSADMVRLDQTNTPQITYGFNVSIDYHAFSLFANFAGASKVWQPFRFQALLGYNALQDLLDNRYTEGSMNSKYPTLPQQSGVNSLASTFWLYNTSFMRLKTLELGYDLPHALLSKVRLEGARIYINGSNLLTFSKMKLFDPETNDPDGFFYPQSRIYNLGINITF
ncbi:TonB-dependent receptor [Ginsengibacter hankyongi]|uniref:TonB-dependent receptor n=1 Tax=Ginsengibacter hankyongi TaxID=2607284 RepID=A0A5J5IHR1_9BACT|nr:TonB-dependent receptor [Ginsengibacter hankyongi]KAA9038660.1 TonB-dependent receptor [Ginsengibacter hankyongi]